MASISQWFANELIRIAAQRDTYTPAWNQFDVAALLDTPVLETDETFLLEPTAAQGYSRLTIPFPNTTNWVMGLLGETSYAPALTFAACSGSNWGAVVGVALVASASGGGFTKQVAAYFGLPNVPRILVGDQLQIPASTLTLGIHDSQ